MTEQNSLIQLMEQYLGLESMEVTEELWICAGLASIRRPSLCSNGGCKKNKHRS